MLNKKPMITASGPVICRLNSTAGTPISMVFGCASPRASPTGTKSHPTCTLSATTAGRRQDGRTAPRADRDRVALRPARAGGQPDRHEVAPDLHVVREERWQGEGRVYGAAPDLVPDKHPDDLPDHGRRPGQRGRERR